MNEKIEEIKTIIPINERLNKLEETLNNNKTKKLRFPAKAKVSKGRMKKGWISIFRLGENGHWNPTRVQIDGSVFDFLKKEGHYHSTSGNEITFWNGKPCIFQEDKRLNPKLFKFNEGENQTYGQKNIIAAILRDTIKVKGKGMNLGVIGVILVIAVVGYVLGKYVFKWF